MMNDNEHGDDPHNNNNNNKLWYITEPLLTEGKVKDNEALNTNQQERATEECIQKGEEYENSSPREEGKQF